MSRKSLLSIARTNPRWFALLFLLPTCSNESPELASRQATLTPRILKAAPVGEVATWRRMTSATAPEGRFLQALAFDETRGLVVMFGGQSRGLTSSAVQPLQDMWEWAPVTGTWTLRATSDALPAPRGGAAMVFDPVRNKILLFGGRAASGYDYEDLWEWDPTTGAWTDRTGTGNHPAARAQHAMLYQKSTNKILLFGGGRSSTTSDGISVSASFGDTWELDPATATWTALAPTASPSMRHDFGLVWDSTKNKAVLFGGLQIDIPGATGVPKQDTWEWDPAAQTWTERTATGSKPSQRFALAMAYDDTRGRVVLFGGSDMQKTGNSKNDMWEWDATTAVWTQTRTGGEAGMPVVCSYSSMVYDHAHARLEMVAGLIPYSDSSSGYQGVIVPSNQVWEIDPATLTFSNRTVVYKGPSARSYQATAYNPTTGKVYVFGGVDIMKKSSELSDLWEWDGQNWNQVTGDSKLQGRIDAAMAYDPARQSLILFGGNSWSGGSSIPNDTWEWSSTTRQWSPLTTTGSPDARWGHAMVTDPARKKILLYGGSGAKSSISSEIWEWDGAALTWTNRTPPPSAKTPGGRTYPVMSFDETRGKLVLFDGNLRPSPDGESTSAYWEWDGVTGGWALYDPGETLASATNVYAVYDSIRRRHVLFTDAPDSSSPQTWELDSSAETWYTRIPSPTPGGRFRSGMAFDSTRRVMVLFGGNVNSSPSGPANDTWEYTVSKLANGEGCTAASAASCASGQCVDGVCCETAGCTGACMACNVHGSEGTCVLALAGTEVAGSCSNGQACDGAGACKSKNGQACTAASGCASGFCVDGVCCDGACTGACKACNLTGRVGTCTPQAAGSDPDSECSQGTGVCKSSCDGVGACAFPLGLSCGSCLVCDGAGACTRSDPSCGTGGTGGKDSGTGKTSPGSGGIGGSVVSSGGVGGKSDSGVGGKGGSGGSVSSSGGKGGGVSSSPNGGSIAGAISSSPNGGSGGGAVGGAVSSSPNGGSVSSSAGNVGGSSSNSGGQGGGSGSSASNSLPRDAGAGSDGSAGGTRDGGAAQGDAGDGGLVGKLGSGGCSCDLGRAETRKENSLMWLVLVGACLPLWRSRRRRQRNR
jgi:hypothetical protein